MTRLPEALHAWSSATYASTLKMELKALPAGSLPLSHGLGQGGMVDDSDLELTVLDSAVDARVIRTRVGCFFTEVVGGCNCHDDPYAEHAYCELLVRIDRETAAASFAALAD